jgi:hypothetical protein
MQSANRDVKNCQPCRMEFAAHLKVHDFQLSKEKIRMTSFGFGGARKMNKVCSKTVEYNEVGLVFSARFQLLFTATNLIVIVF